MEFVLKNCMRHGQYAFPKSMVTYDVVFPEPIREDRVRLICCGESVTHQFSEKQLTDGQLHAAKLSFITELPEHSEKRFSLETGVPEAEAAIARWDGGVLVLQNDYLALRIADGGDSLFEICQANVNGAARLGESFQKSIELLENGPVFARVRITAAFPDGCSYVQQLTVNACDPYVLLDETMDPAHPGALDITWHGLEPEYRIHKRNNSGVDYRRSICPWLAADTYTDDDGLIRYIRLAPYDSTSGAAGTHMMSFLGSELAAGVFCTNAMDWRDGTFTIEGYDYRNLPQFYCKYVDGICDPRFHYPINGGTRHTVLALYPRQWEQMDATYSYIERLWFRTARVSLDRFKDWVLELPLERDSFPRFFDRSRIDPQIRYGFAGQKGLPTAEAFIKHITASLLYTQPLKSGACYTRIYEHWVPAFDLLAAEMSDEEFETVVATLLLGAYCCELEDSFPTENMLGGHPNFLLDYKNCVGMCAALFPEHPCALRWKDHYEKAVSRLLKYHVRPAVKTWDAQGGRYTESYGTYLWGSMKHGTEATLLLTLRYGDNPMLYPQLEELGNWIVNFMTAPLDGRRTVPYSGAHAGCHERNPFYPLWNVRALGLALRYYNPVLSQQLLGICPPEERYMGHENFCDGMDEDIWSQLLAKIPGADAPGLEPVLRSSKFTGYGFNLRSHVGETDEMHVVLQQLDEGPNYRWGRAALGGCGNLQYYADGKRFSGVRKEDFGDDNFRDDDVGCNFCVLLDHTYRSIGQNDLLHPLVDLDFVQYARADAGSHSNAEYRYRSVLMVDNRYIVIYDAVRDEHTEGKFIWNNFVDEPMPYIHQLVPGSKPRAVEAPKLTIDGAPRYPAVRQDKDTRGVIYDGYGDFLTVVTHRDGIRAEATPFGAIVREESGADYIFQSNAYGKYSVDGMEFAGKLGFARLTEDGAELALLDGQYIALPGCKLTRLAGSGRISLRKTGQTMTGKVSGGQITVRLDAYAEPGSKVYQNGREVSWENGMLTLMPGSFQITASAPIPAQVTKVSYVNTPEGVQIVFDAVPFADRYEAELDGVVLPAADAQLCIAHVAGTPILRVRALNQGGAGAWSDPIRVQVLTDKPRHVDGLRVMAKKNGYQILWGQMAGVSSYRLYRADSGKPMQCIYEGADTRYFDPAADETAVYYVSCVNGYGESELSLPRDTRPGGAAYYDPAPEVRFQRNTLINHHGYGGFDYVYNENRKILTYPE